MTAYTIEQVRAASMIDDNALIQHVGFSQDGEETCTESMSGREAIEELTSALNYGCAPVYDAGLLMGAVRDDGSRFECWQCDECTWSEYEENGYNIP